MTTNEKVARRQFGLLELTKERGNLRKARKVMGYSRQQFDENRLRVPALYRASVHPDARTAC
jgi:hypothetical protein